MRPPLLHADEITAALRAVPLWQVSGEAITRTCTGDSFRTVIDWVDAIADAAERLDHHPDLDIRWTSLHVTLSTHDRGGLTALDFALAAQIDEICR
jgi:4a-hydroxytetrahydrobiopterin dehydratase